ncbi:energy transducer TonB family protein [Methyloferula stellata]|uniref:energy transducer TonB family protein n=1 Tax=Methyloferula stellata TaxID=876270 RepID=UPI000379CE13|nr:energy transducer TonB [Methyloferula stellata]
MSDEPIKRKLKFTIFHGFVASVLIHSAVALPFVTHSLDMQPDDEPELLVVELQGPVADEQTDQKVLQETKGQTPKEETKPDDPKPTPPEPVKAAASEDQPKDIVENDKEPGLPPPTPPEPTPTPPMPQADPTPPKTEQKTASPGANNVQGAEQQQKPQTIKTDPDEAERLKAYSRLISKKVRANLFDHPERKSATVTFTILSNGQIRPDSLKIVESSGLASLDASALKTVHACLPFPPPPMEEMPVKLFIDFGRK